MSARRQYGSSSTPVGDKVLFAGGLSSSFTPSSVAGNTVHCHWCGRDQGFPAPCNTTLSNALEYDIGS